MSLQQNNLDFISWLLLDYGSCSRKSVLCFKDKLFEFGTADTTGSLLVIGLRSLTRITISMLANKLYTRR